MNTEHPAKQDPWDRFGWVMASVWLLFLAFPLVAAIASDRSIAARTVSAVAILAFAGFYIWAFVRIGTTETTAAIATLGRRYLALLVALCGVVGALIGTEALGMVPFLASLAMFTLPIVHAFVVAGVCVVATGAIPLATGEPEQAALFTLITLAVAAACATVRILDDRSKEARHHAEELALVTERDRVARDVHDVLGHSLTVVHAKAQLAHRMMDIDPPRARAELEAIQALARQSLAEIRSTVSGLRMPRLDEELTAAAGALSGAGIIAALPSDSDVVDPRHRLVLAWVLREAVTNVVRHSAADRCSVDLESDRLVVTDDGRGITPATEGNGLRGLRERVSAAGGTLTLDQAPGGGTRLEVRL